MKRILLGVAALTLLAALVPANASARHTLAHRVSTLEAKLACLTKTPVFEYGDPAGSLAGPGYLWDNDATDGVPDASFTTSALDFYFEFDPDFPPDAWFLTVKPSSTCRSKFATTPTPVWWPEPILAARSAAGTLSARAR